MRKKTFLLLFIFIFMSVIAFECVDLIHINQLSNGFYVSYEEVETVNQTKAFGKLVSLNMDSEELTTDGSKSDEGTIIFKLLGFIPIKKVKVKLLPEEEVYVGGLPVGLSVNTDGIIVVSDSVVDIENSVISKSEHLKNGDIIIKINNEKITSIKDVDRVIENLETDTVLISFIRNNKTYDKEVKLLKDKDGKYKLGLWVKDDVSGIGTLTFVRQNNNFGALGHAVTSGQNENIIPVKDGKLYNCTLIGISKGEKNNPGELKCVFVPKGQSGTICKNTQYGIYGNIENMEDLVDTNVKAYLGGRLSVKPGEATIVSTISGIREEYKIEIIKANYQMNSNDKSIIFRVKDERLLELTGGIVQGMSGSPIIQNGKVIGAVTHVFLSDPTKGYGVYSDWMLEQMNFD